MINAQSLVTLQTIVRKLGSSMLQYITMSDPLKSADTKSEWEAILALAEEERDMIGRFARLLRKHRTPIPMLGTYPMMFTTINYMPIGHLVKLLINSQKKCVADLEQCDVADDDEEASTLLADCTAMAKRHLQSLEGLQTKPEPLAS